MSKTGDIVPFNLGLYKKGDFRVTTIGGLKVDLLDTANKSDKEYSIVGHIGKGTQLEKWTVLGKYYSKNKEEHYNDLIMIKNGK